MEDKYLCGCPGPLRTARLPKTVDLVVIGCDVAKVVESPTGRMVLALELESGGHYVVDTETGKRIKIKWPAQRFYETLFGNNIIRFQLAFLADDALFSYQGLKDEPQIINYRTGKGFRLRRICILIDECLNDPAVSSEFDNASHIYLLDGYVVGLRSNYLEDPSNSFVIQYESILPIQRYLQEKGIAYHLSNSIKSVGRGRPPDPDQVPDPDPSCGRLMSSDSLFYYRQCQNFTEGGIYHHATGRRLADPLPHYEPLGWTHDNSGVLLSRTRECVLQIFTDACSGWSPAHVLELKVPEEYLSGDENSIGSLD